MRTALLLLAFGGCTSAWEKELAAFHAARAADIAGEEGWLTLLGRFELREGDNPVGSGDGAWVKLPADRAQGVIGTITLRGDALTWAPAGASPTPIVDDTRGPASVIPWGSLRMHVIARNGRRYLRVKDREHPALKTFTGLTWYPADARWKLAGTFEPAAPEATVEVTNVLQMTAPQRSPGSVRFEVDGVTHRLVAIADSEPGLFLVFKDETAGHGTYPAGRFLHTSVPAADGSVTVDFNRAYSPPCAFTKFATCPLPPKGNALPLKIEAGERFAGH
jgi:hypothetical protein